MRPLRWQEAYLGVSAILGEPLEESLGALGGGPPADRGVASAGALRSGAREARARAIAGTVAEVLAALDTLRLR